MRADTVQRLDRRKLLLTAATLIAGGAGPAFGQTFIHETPAFDVGVARVPETERGNFSSGQGGSRPQATASGPPTTASQPTLSMQTDWRSYLLSGERSVLMGRDGGLARRVRYAYADGTMDRDGYAQACFLLRDVRAGKLYPMDPRLLDLLCGLQRWAEYNGKSAVIQALSGFRTTATNASLEGAARNSMHLQGRAADFVFEGISSGVQGAMVKAFNVQGGTGVYLNRGFVHADTGSARSWVSTTRSRR